MTASHKLAEMMYSKSRQGAGAQAGPGGAAGADGHTGAEHGGAAQHETEEKKEDVVDADFKEVK